MNIEKNIKRFDPAIKEFNHIIHGADYNPDQWLNYPEIIAEDMKLMKQAAMNSASVGIFAWKAIEPKEGVYCFEWLDHVMDMLEKNGIKVILATPSGARPAWMDRAHSEVLRVSKSRVRNLHGERHNHCYTAPYYREKVRSMNTMLAERYKNHKALAMWHISNEYGGECHCELCQEAFRTWLRKKYHNNIEELNEQWWTYFWSHGFRDFDEIESPSEHGEHSTHGLKLDWKRFVSEQTHDFYCNEIKPLREITPQIPVTTNLMGLYDGINPWVMAADMDYAAWDNYPKWHNPYENVWETACSISFIHDIYRRLKGGKPFLMMESTPSQVNWMEVNKLKAPGMHELSSIQAIAHGADSVQYFQWRKGRGSSEKLHGAVVDHCGRTDTRVFREVAALGENLKRLDEIVGTTVSSKVAIIYDWENKWAIDDLQGWNQEREYPEVCGEHYQAFWKQGISVDIINMDENFSGYQLIAAPVLYMLRKGVSKRLKEYVREGGRLILTYGSGEVNENDLCFLGGFPGDGLGEAAGVWAEEINPLYPEEKNSIILEKNFDGMKERYNCRSMCEIIHTEGECETLAVYGDDFYQGQAVLTRNPYGRGYCYYIATRPEQSFLDDFYQTLCVELKIQSEICEYIPEGITIQQRCGDGDTYYFIMNFSEKKQTLQLKQNIQLINLMTKEKPPLSIAIEKYGYLILKKL